MKKIIGCLLILVLLFSQPVFASAATGSSSIAKPKVSVKVVDNTYAKVSWKKCAGAVKYEVWRLMPYNDGLYGKIATTKKLQYTDKGLTGNTSYRYKVVAVGKNGKKSAMSNRSKEVNIPCDWKIITPKGRELYTLVGDAVYFTVEVEGTTRKLTTSVYNENVIVTIVNKKNNTYTLKAECVEPEYNRIHHYSIFLGFKGSKLCSEMLTLNIIPPTSATKLNGVPLFSTIISKDNAKIYNDSMGYYVYSYASINKAVRQQYEGYEEPVVDGVVNAYINLLQSPTYGFTHIETSSNNDGGSDYIFRNSKGQSVAISTRPYFEDEAVLAMVVDK